MIQFDKVNFAYKQKKILANFSFVFNDQTIYSLFAPSGTGKTTLLNLVARINAPQSGTIENSAKRISYCFQEILLVNELTIFANLELVLFSVYKNRAKRKQIIMK
jgi:NitT/TauT family transport system ATP-binding protein